MLLEQVGDPAVPEEVEMYPLPDTGPTGNLLELRRKLAVFERLILAGDEHEVLAGRFVRVIPFPGSE